MKKSRLEAFSDGVLAIIITIMVLEMKVPHEANLSALRPLLPVFISYVMSFIYLAIYWNNHHHLIHTVSDVNGAILWANFHLLFWLSLVPFVTGWLGENNFAALPMLFYGIVLFMAALAYSILEKAIIRGQGVNSLLKKAVGRDRKEKISLLLYLLAIGLAWFFPWAAGALYVAVALLWVVPDRRIETHFRYEE